MRTAPKENENTGLGPLSVKMADGVPPLNCLTKPYRNKSFTWWLLIVGTKTFRNSEIGLSSVTNLYLWSPLGYAGFP